MSSLEIRLSDFLVLLNRYNLSFIKMKSSDSIDGVIDVKFLTFYFLIKPHLHENRLLLDFESRNWGSELLQRALIAHLAKIINFCIGFKSFFSKPSEQNIQKHENEPPKFESNSSGFCIHLDICFPELNFHSAIWSTDCLKIQFNVKEKP